MYLTQLKYYLNITVIFYDTSKPVYIVIICTNSARETSTYLLFEFF